MSYYSIFLQRNWCQKLTLINIIELINFTTQKTPIHMNKIYAFFLISLFSLSCPPSSSFVHKSGARLHRVPTFNEKLKT